jgi:hypothetical protein
LRYRKKQLRALGKTNGEKMLAVEDGKERREEVPPSS